MQDDNTKDSLAPRRRSSRIERKQTEAQAKASSDNGSEAATEDQDMETESEYDEEEEYEEQDLYTEESTSDGSEEDETYQEEEAEEKDQKAKDNRERAVPTLDRKRRSEEEEPDGPANIEASSPSEEKSPSYSPNTQARLKRRKLRRPGSSTTNSVPAADMVEMSIIEEDKTFEMTFNMMDSSSRNVTPITIGTSKGLRSDSPNSRTTKHNKKGSSLAEKLARRIGQDSPDLDLSKHVVVPEIKFDRQDKEEDEESMHRNESGGEEQEEMMEVYYNESTQQKLVHGDLHPEMQLDTVNVEDLDNQHAPAQVEEEQEPVSELESKPIEKNAQEQEASSPSGCRGGLWPFFFRRKSSNPGTQSSTYTQEPRGNDDEPVSPGSFWSRLFPYGPYYDL